MAVANYVQLSDAVAHNRFSAEFFDPRYVFSPSPHVEWAPIGCLLKRCEYGLSISMNSVGRGFPMFRMNEIDGCFALRPEKYADIPASTFKEHALYENDVLFNRTNSFEFVGRTGLVKDQTDCTFASYLIRLVPDSDRLLPEFLTIYLNTKFGVGQVRRRAMRSINQANVSASEVRKILIPVPKVPFQQTIADDVNSAFIRQRESLANYTRAERLLEAALGLDRLQFQRSLGYTARCSELETSHRSDSQHFQPHFRELIEHISIFPSDRIRNMRIYNRRGFQPVYMESGPVAVINSQHIGPQHIDYEGLEKTSTAAFAAVPEAHIKLGDLLIYTTGAHIGRTNVYLSDVPAMASNHVNILRIRPGIDSA